MAQSQDSYDAIPYESTPFARTHPDNLAVLGHLFGLSPESPERCRVLEIGCASGGNLIPMAWRLPESQFVGVEVSAAQANAAKALCEELGLDNLQIHCADILYLGENLGTFDYVLCHGVYSWVPEPVRAHILGLCGAQLSDHGIAYISFNTLPGWRMRGMLRDILLHHTRRETEPARKVTSARECLEGMAEALGGIEALSAEYLRHEIEYLRGAHPSYLYHEYLEDINQPFLFTEFMEAAGGHGLQYLCELELATMFAGTLSAGAERLVEGFDDLVEQEQYLDFIRARNFRETLLCRAERDVSRDIELERLADLAFYSDLAPPRKLDLRRGKPAPFTAPDGARYHASHPWTKAALAYLNAVYPDAVHFSELREHAQRQVAGVPGQPFADPLDHLKTELFSLYANQAIGMRREPERVFRALKDKPRATRLARLQGAKGAGHLPTWRHATLQTDAFAARLVSHLDGRRDRAELTRLMLEEVERGYLVPEKGASTAASLAKQRDQIAAQCAGLLALFARYGVLEE